MMRGSFGCRIFANGKLTAQKKVTYTPNGFIVIKRCSKCDTVQSILTSILKLLKSHVSSSQSKRCTVTVHHTVDECKYV